MVLQTLTLWRCWIAPKVILVHEDDFDDDSDFMLGDDVPTALPYDDEEDDMQAADWWKHGKEPPY